MDWGSVPAGVVGGGGACGGLCVAARRAANFGGSRVGDGVYRGIAVPRGEDWECQGFEEGGGGEEHTETGIKREDEGWGMELVYLRTGIVFKMYF